MRLATSSVVSCHVPIRSVSACSVSTMRLMLFFDGRYRDMLLRQFSRGAGEGQRFRNGGHRVASAQAAGAEFLQGRLRPGLTVIALRARQATASGDGTCRLGGYSDASGNFGVGQLFGCQCSDRVSRDSRVTVQWLNDSYCRRLS
jgi:hypothetical protein